MSDLKKSDKKLEIFPQTCKNVFQNLNKRGQVTIFIIMAVVIVVLGVLIYMFLPEIKITLGFGSENPSSFMQTCLGEDITDSLELISTQGGFINPQHYFLKNNEKIAYLCYTNEYYKLGVVQVPFIGNHVENEIKRFIEPSVEECFQKMSDRYEEAGYEVVLRPGETSVELLPKRVVVSFNYTLALKKGGEVLTYGREGDKGIRVILDNNLYELTSIANSILRGEAEEGDVEVMKYMSYYNDLIVEKKKQSDGTTIYILTDLNSQNKFQFASRSLAWPPGY